MIHSGKKTQSIYWMYIRDFFIHIDNAIEADDGSERDLLIGSSEIIIRIICHCLSLNLIFL